MAGTKHTRPIKTVLRIAAWAAIAAAIMCWPKGPTSFDARWVAMPAAMTGEMFIAARKAAERPTAMIMAELQAQLTTDARLLKRCLH